MISSDNENNNIDDFGDFDDVDDFGDFDDFDDESPNDKKSSDETIKDERSSSLRTSFLIDAENYDFKSHFSCLFEGFDEERKISILKSIKNFIKPPNPEDRRTYKLRLYKEYNDLISDIAKKLNDDSLEDCHRIALRYMLFGDSFLKEIQINKLKEIPFEHIEYSEEDNEPYFYVDEWLTYVNKGVIRSSEGDDLTAMQGKKGDKKFERYKTLKSGLTIDQKVLETNLKERKRLVDTISQLWQTVSSNDLSVDTILNTSNFKIDDAKPLSNMKVIVGKLEATNKFLNRHIAKIALTKRQMKDLEGQIKCDDTEEATPKLIETEWGQLKQMAKIAVGRTGNDFPFLTKQYFNGEILTRELLKKIMDEILYLDPELFYWKSMGIESKRCPYICIVPCYASVGMCWEPIDFKNKVSGRGKLAFPLIPEDIPKKVVLATIADYRWQKCKEAAGPYWMSEGLTSKYYMYHEELRKKKRKGIEVKGFIKDLKSSFINDYVMWMYFESQGMQKLSKEARSIMWNTLPFPEELTDKLKDKGFAYKQLWENDQRKKQSRR